MRLAALAGLLALLPAPAAAQDSGPERLAVLPILVGAAALAEPRPVFSWVERAADLRPGLRPMTIDDYYFHEGDRLAREVLSCGSDGPCMASRLRPFGARLGLVVVVNGELSPPLVSVLLLDGAEGKITSEWAGQVAAEGLADAVTTQARLALDKAGFQQAGRLKVRVQPRQASLRVGEDTLPDLGTPDTFTLMPGRYAVQGLAEGHRSGTVEADVRAGETVWVDLELAEETGSWVSSPWFWVGASVVAAGVAAGVTAAAVGGGGDQTCVCVITRDQMDCGGCP